MAHVFLSYAREDLAWASALHARLSADAITVFQDMTELVKGLPWPEQIDKQLREAHVLVCLWSRNASAFVHRELADFSALSRVSKRKRPIVLVQLDDSPNAYAELEQIDDPAIKHAYLASSDPPGGGLWTRVVADIEHAMRQDAKAVPVTVVPMTLTAAEFDPLWQEEGEQLTSGLQVSYEEMRVRYAGSRLQWRPFVDDDRTLGQLLDRVAEAVKAPLGAKRYIRWDPAPDAFLNAGEEGEAAANRVVSDLGRARFGIIVIDPVALCSNVVRARLARFNECLNKSEVAVVAVPTRLADERTRKLREWLRDKAKDLLAWHFEPIPGQRLPQAHVELEVDDETSFLRLIRYSVATTLKMKTRSDAGVLKNKRRTRSE